MGVEARIRRSRKAGPIVGALVLASALTVAIVLVGRGDRAAGEARWAVAGGRFEEAAAPLGRWLRARPESAEAHLLKARVAYARGSIYEASFHLDRARWLAYPE